MTPALDLVPVWTAILAIGVFVYVGLTGSTSVSGCFTTSRPTAPRANR